jgi:hypothetical protein
VVHPVPGGFAKGQQTTAHVVGPVAVTVAVDVPFVFDVCVVLLLSHGSEPTSKTPGFDAAAIAVTVTSPAATQTVAACCAGGMPAKGCPLMVMSHQPL